MLEFYDIVFLYGKKNVNNSTLLKTAFIAFITNTFSKKKQLPSLDLKRCQKHAILGFSRFFNLKRNLYAYFPN